MLFLTALLVGLNSCYLPDIHLHETLRPLRKLFNQERNYWTDRMELKGVTGIELVYYKNGRPALQRYFNKAGLLETVTYLGRNGAPIRLDSLAYSKGQLIAGYYYSEPGHSLSLRFLNYKQQGQLSQRSWFGSAGELLSREFFLFDRNGHRRTRMIFDENDVLLYSETYNPKLDQLDVQNTYADNGALVSQVRYEPNQSAYRYDFDAFERVIKITDLNHADIPLWSNDLLYDEEGTLKQCNFSTNDRFLFTYLGDLEFYRQTMRNWKHPAQPGTIDRQFKMGHQDPFVVERTRDSQGYQVVEYSLPKTGALFKRSILDQQNKPVSDTLYTGRGMITPVSVVNYDLKGLVSSEVTYDLEGEPKWKHTWFRDEASRVIREELIALPDTFSAAVTRFYDPFDLPALSEQFSSPDSFDGSWVFFQGGGINKTLYYNDLSVLTESWSFRPAGDTIQHSRFQALDYFYVESKLGVLDTLLSQRRFTPDGILDWELFFDGAGQLLQEIHKKKDGSIFRNVSYNPETRVIKSSTFAPIEYDQIPAGKELKGEIASQVITRLNASGEIVQVISRNSSGEIDWEKRYAFRGGRLVKSAQLGPDGKPAVISSYTHNETGQVLTETALDSTENLVHTVEYRYNEKQEMIWKTFSSVLTGTISSNRFYYDDQGRLYRNEIIEAQRFIEAVEYTYFPEYTLRIATHYDPDGEVLRKGIENYFGENIFSSAPVENK